MQAEAASETELPGAGKLFRNLRQNLPQHGPSPRTSACAALLSGWATFPAPPVTMTPSPTPCGLPGGLLRPVLMPMASG